MPQHPTCPRCNAGRPDLRGICTDCDGCMSEHCQCDPCQHGKSQEEECVFCLRWSSVIDVMVRHDDIDADLRWLTGGSDV